MNFKLDHINLSVKNLEESLLWYKNVFGLEFLEGGLKNGTQPWAIVGKDDCMVCMYQEGDIGDPTLAGGRGHRIYHFGFRVSNDKAWEEKLEQLGIQLKYGRTYEYPHSVSWYVEDPSGHEIEVSYSGNGPLKFG